MKASTVVHFSPRLFTRRRFLKVAFGAAAFVVSFFILRPRRAFASVLPPGALTPIDRFRASCQRCGKCAAICPHRAIRLDAEGLPYIDGLSGWCDFCVECVKVCPTGALTPVDPKLAKIGLATVNRKRCLAWLWGGCRLCYEKCSTLQNAISLDKDYRVYVDSVQCNGCGACVNVCPQSSAEGESKNFGRAVLLIVSEDGTQG